MRLSPIFTIALALTSASAFAGPTPMTDLTKDATPIGNSSTRMTLKTPIQIQALDDVKLDDQSRANFWKGERDCDTGDIICGREKHGDPLQPPFVGCHIKQNWTCPFSSSNQIDKGTVIQLSVVDSDLLFWTFDGVGADGSTYTLTCNDPVHYTGTDTPPATTDADINQALDASLLTLDIDAKATFTPVPCDLQHHWDFAGGPTPQPAAPPAPAPTPKKQSAFKRFLHKIL